MPPSSRLWRGERTGRTAPDRGRRSTDWSEHAPGRRKPPRCVGATLGTPLEGSPLTSSFCYLASRSRHDRNFHSRCPPGDHLFPPSPLLPSEIPVTRLQQVWLEGKGVRTFPCTTNREGMH